MSSNEEVFALLLLSGAAGWSVWAWRQTAEWWDGMQKDPYVRLPYRCLPGMVLGVATFVVGIMILHAIFSLATGERPLFRILLYGWVAAFVSLQASVALFERPRLLIPPGVRHQCGNRRRL